MQKICFQCQENPVYAYLATLLLNKAGGNDFRGYCHDITLDTEVSEAIAYSKLIPHQTTPMSLTEQYDFSIQLNNLRVVLRTMAAPSNCAGI